MACTTTALGGAADTTSSAGSWVVVLRLAVRGRSRRGRRAGDQRLVHLGADLGDQIRERLRPASRFGLEPIEREQSLLEQRLGERASGLDQGGSDHRQRRAGGDASREGEQILDPNVHGLPTFPHVVGGSVRAR
jgi:hypothetical protein